MEKWGRKSSIKKGVRVNMMGEEKRKSGRKKEKKEKKGGICKNSIFFVARKWGRISIGGWEEFQIGFGNIHPCFQPFGCFFFEELYVFIEFEMPV